MSAKPARKRAADRARRGPARPARCTGLHWLASLALLTSAGAQADVYMCGRADAPRYSDVRDAADCRLLIPERAALAGGAAQQGSPAAAAHRAAMRRATLPAIEAAARRHGLSPALLEALVAVESDFRSDAVSSKGAMGLTQLMPATAIQLGVTDAFDVLANLDGGARHLRSLLDRYGGDLRLSLAAYNAGAGAVERHGMTVPPFAETRSYVQRIMQRYGDGLRACRQALSPCADAQR